MHKVLEGIFKQAIESGEITATSPLLLTHVFSTVTVIGNKKEVISELVGVEQTTQTLIDLFWTSNSLKMFTD